MRKLRRTVYQQQDQANVEEVKTFFLLSPLRFVSQQLILLETEEIIGILKKNCFFFSSLLKKMWKLTKKIKKKSQSKFISLFKAKMPGVTVNRTKFFKKLGKTMSKNI